MIMYYAWRVYLLNFWRGYVAIGFESAGADMLEM